MSQEEWRAWASWRGGSGAGATLSSVQDFAWPSRLLGVHPGRLVAYAPAPPSCES